ncbi:MAG: FG-GAP-like repeat-containing protein [Chitinophagales bacterium]
MGNFFFYKSILELPAQTIFVQFPIRLDLVDINSDNHKDIIIDNSYEYFYYLNDGNDNFSIKQTLPLRETFDSPYLFSYLFEDLNGDNHPDFLYNSIGFNTSLSEINYSLSDANGVQHFNNYQNVHGDSLYYSKNIHSNDIDNDGDNDIVFYFYNRIGWYKNKGNGSFESPYFLETGVNYINQVELADVNNNGNVDILYTYNDNNIAYYKNNGNGNFTSQSLVNIIDSITAIHSIDIDNDGFNDILFSNSNKLAWYKNDGNNIFSTENIISITDTFNNCTLLSNDVNNDGHIDIISAVNGGKLLWYQNNGSGSFSAPQIITNNCNYTEIYSTDVDNDSSIDLIYNIPNTSNLTWFKNDGNGIFNSIDITTGANPIKAFTIADIDRDGTNNIVCLTQNNTTILSKDDSTGLFTVAYTIVNDITDDYLHSILTPDIDGDGISDLLISSIVQLFWRQNLIEKPLIKAIAFYDENNNGVQDGSERLLNFAEILVAPNELGVFTSSDGYALFVLDTGAYVISAIIDTNWMQTTIPEVYNLDLSNYNTTDTLYFGFTPKHLINDLKFTNIAQANTRCARDIPFQITYTNTGTTKLNGYVTVTEENLITYVDSPNNTPTDSTSGSERFWFFDDLYPTESKTIIQYYTVADQSFAGDTLTLSAQAVVPVLYNNATAYHNNTGSTTTDKVTICHCTAADNDHYVVLEVPLSAIDSFGYNDYIFYDCDIVPITDIDGDGDIDTDDCKAKKPSYDEIAINGPFYSLIFCSFDPNDKQANPKGEGENNLTYKDEDIIYIIRFQNTGNDTAFHVQITDSLDKNLDINTFKFIAASHSNLQIQKQTYNIGTANEYHELSFTFHPIILPDSATNEVASQGFVSFSIKPKKDLPENTVINNTANIVFDKFTNYPVITNTVTNTLVSNLRVTTAILEKKYDVGINAYPNPFNSMVNIELSKPSTQQSVDISIVNIEGKRLKVLTNITNNNINIDLSSIATGAYFIAVEDTQTKELIGIKKIVKQ